MHADRPRLGLAQPAARELERASRIECELLRAQASLRRAASMLRAAPSRSASWLDFAELRSTLQAERLAAAARSKRHAEALSAVGTYAEFEAFTRVHAAEAVGEARRRRQALCKDDPGIARGRPYP